MATCKAVFDVTFFLLPQLCCLFLPCNPHLLEPETQKGQGALGPEIEKNFKDVCLVGLWGIWTERKKKESTGSGMAGHATPPAHSAPVRYILVLTPYCSATGNTTDQSMVSCENGPFMVLGPRCSTIRCQRPMKAFPTHPSTAQSRRQKDHESSKSSS